MSTAETHPRQATRDGHLTDEQSLLDSALTGHGWADDELCERHAGALFCLARAVLGAREPAETVVVGVVADACTRPGLVSLGAGRSLRHELARMTYERCTAAGGQPAGARPRSLLALCAWGAHTYRQAGALMGMPASAVPGMLRASLLEVPQRRRG